MSVGLGIEDEGREGQSFVIVEFNWSGHARTPQQPRREAGQRKSPDSLRDKVLHGGFCTSENRIWARILGNKFWAPEFWTRIPGSNYLSLFFSSKRGPQKNSPSRNSPLKIHLPKFNPEIGQKNSHCTSAGPFD